MCYIFSVTDCWVNEMRNVRKKFITLRATDAEIQVLKDAAKLNKENVSALLRGRIFYSSQQKAA